MKPEYIDDDISFLEYIKLIGRHKIAILVIFLFIVISVFVYTLLQPQKFISTSSILIRSEGSGGLEALMSKVPMAAMLGGSGVSGDSAYVLCILNSESFSFDVYEKLKLIENKHFWGNINNPPSRNQVIGILKSWMTIKADKSSMILISAKTGDPELSALLSNTYYELLDEKLLTKSSKKADLIKKQLEKSEKELKQSEKRLEKFQAQNKIMFDESLATKLIADYLLYKNQKDQGKIEIAKQQDMLKFTSQIDELNTIQSRISSIEAEDKALNDLLKKYNKELTGIQGKLLDYMRLKRDRELREDVYLVFLKQFELLKMSDESENVNFQIIDKAYPPDGPCEPNMKLNLMLAVIVGIAFGIFYAFLAETLVNFKIKKD